MPQGPSKRLQQLSEKAAQLKQEIARVRELETERERKQEARRRTIVGTLVLSLVERGEWPAEPLREALDKHVTLARDRALFGLPVDPTPPSSEAVQP